MQMLRVFALIYFAATGLLVAGAVSMGQWVLVAAALTAALGGVLLMAVDLALVRLTEIRDALRGDILDLHRFRSGLLRAILAIKETGYGSDT